MEASLAHFLAGLTFGWGDRVTPLYPPPSPALARVAVELTALPFSHRWPEQRAALAAGGTVEIHDTDGSWHLGLDSDGVLRLYAPGDLPARGGA